MNRPLRSFRVGGAVFGIAPRLLLVAVVWFGAVSLVPFPLWQGVAVIAALVALVIPRSMSAWLAAACLAFGVVLTEPSPQRTALAVLLVHAVHLLGSLSLVIPARSRLALGVLLPSLLRFAVVQLLAQPLVFAVWLLVPSRVDRGIGWIAPIAAAMLLLGAILAVWAAKRADAALVKRRD
ncbi:hypothetical protein [Microbacterium sp. PMB16]|uniref:hypothetical protein n=1 Tax=Microbacterium sp. PMB16 TaxID=3120157 RepID=UPI003F4BCD73